MARVLSSTAASRLNARRGRLVLHSLLVVVLAGLGAKREEFAARIEEQASVRLRSQIMDTISYARRHAARTLAHTRTRIRLPLCTSMHAHAHTPCRALGRRAP